MSSDDREQLALFGDDEWRTPGTTAKPKRKRAVPKVRAVAARADGRYRVIVSNDHKVVHAAVSDPDADGAVATACKLVGAAYRFTAGELIAACVECAVDYPPREV